MNGLASTIGSIGGATGDLVIRHQFQTACRCTQEHILTTLWQSGDGRIAGTAPMHQRVIIGDTCYHFTVSFRLVGPQVGVEVARVAVINLITRLCLV